MNAKFSMNRLVVLLTIFSVTFFTNCNKDNDDFQPEPILLVDGTEGYSSINLTACQNNLDNLPYQSLSDAEKAGILLMREEEKMARDLYLQLYDKWDLLIFNNISESEATHFAAMLKLIQKYNLDDPAENNGPGVFTNQTLQTIYDTLLQKGESSIIEGLNVGAAIEEIDILDLKNQLETVVDNQDIEMVYENLMRASRNHLRAFVRNLENRGETYVPQYLDPMEYDDILKSDWENGKP